MSEIAQHCIGFPACPQAMPETPRHGRLAAKWHSGLRQKGLRLSAALMVIGLAACGRAPTEDILRGGVPARTDLHQASAMPPDAIRSVARKDAGWRLIYHPSRAPANAEQAAAAALCRLEKKRPEQLVVLPMTAPEDDPGARMIDVICG